MLLRKCIRTFPSCSCTFARPLTSGALPVDTTTIDTTTATSDNMNPESAMSGTPVSPDTVSKEKVSEPFLLKNDTLLSKKRTKTHANLSSLYNLMLKHKKQLDTSLAPLRIDAAFDQLDDFFRVKSLFTLRHLFDNKVHMGHHMGCWHSGNKPYLFGIRNNMHIIDIASTEQHLWRALQVASHVAYSGGSIMFVNNRKAFELVTQGAARSCSAKSFTSAAAFSPEEFDRRKPDLVICTSCNHPVARELLLHCNKYLVPTIGILDSDVDPVNITYVIPGNDDSTESLIFYHKVFAKAIQRANLVIPAIQKEKEEQREQTLARRKH